MENPIKKYGTAKVIIAGVVVVIILALMLAAGSVGPFTFNP